MKYRPHRGLLEESMAEVVDVEGLSGLTEHLHNAGYTGVIAVKPYGFDERIGWNTHIVTVDGKAVGFTDQPA